MSKSTVTFTAAAFAVDQEQRTLTGVLLPFGEVSRPARDAATGKTARFSFAAGTVTLPEDPADVVLNYGHDKESLYTQVGVATQLTPQASGVLAKFKVARTPEGDRVLALAEDRILKAFSAEVEGEFTPDGDGVQHAKATTVTGAAVVRVPAFTGAHITSVAASAVADSKEGNDMKCTKCNAVHAAGVIACDPAVQAAFAAATDATVSFTKAEGDALMAQVGDLTQKLADLEKVKIPVGPGTAQFTVVEEPIYRFGGAEAAPSGFDFATDLLAAGKDGDSAALSRLVKFTAARLSPQFATTTDTAAVNPNVYRPDMFLGQAPVPASPLYDFFHKGGLSNVTPFFWSKLDRTNTDVSVHDHTEGTDPADDNLVTATGATVSPIAVSGKVHITREVADQGGNPVVSGLVWSEFERSLKIALETKTAALISAGMAGITALATIPTGTAGPAAGLAVEGGLVDLQFIADGYRFSKAFGHVDLYKALALATNSEDEKIYPILGASNRDGTTASKFAHIDIAGYGMYPAASLGATGAGANNSLVADPAAVHVWNSGLTRLDKLSETVEGWDMGVFAYFAGVLYDVTGLRKITYTK
jgi:hypothetical protein